MVLVRCLVFGWLGLLEREGGKQSFGACSGAFLANVKAKVPFTAARAAETT